MSESPDPPSRHVLGLPLIAVAAVAAVAIAVAIFFIVSSLTSSGADEQQVYVEAIAGAPSRVNPLYAYLNDTDRDISSLVFSGLTRLGKDGEVLPDLAETWDIDDNAVSFNLREGVTWHTGVPFTSADVLFTFGLLADPAFQGDPDQGPLWRQISCNAPNDLTVTCRLPQPFAPFLSFATIGIVPKHILEGVSAEDLYENPFNLAPIGTGPFRLVQIDDQRAVLRAFEDYHLEVPSLPVIQMKFYPDTSTAAAGIIRGDADGLMLDSRASQLDFAALTEEDRLRDYTANRSAYTALYLNNREAPLNEIEVRQAIALTVDLDEINSDILGGRVVRADTPIVPGTWAFNPDVSSPGRDTGEARDLLDKAGWELADDSEVRARNDTELRISIMTDQDPIRGAVAEAITVQLTQIGIAATVVRETSTALIGDFLLPRQYQAAIFSWDPGGDPDPYPAWHSSQITATGRNIAAYSSNDADKVMEDARRTIDLDERQRLYFLFQDQFLEDTPSVVLFYPIFTYFVSEDISGVELGTLFTSASRFSNVHEWTVSDAPDIPG
jgi:peptide/nickel transport system substrate-binding protein